MGISHRASNNARARTHRSHRMWDPVRRIGRTINVRIRIKLGVDLAAPEWTARGGDVPRRRGGAPV